MEARSTLKLLECRRSLSRHLSSINFSRCMHNSVPKLATTIPHQTTPAPPPAPSTPSVSEAEDRVARKRRQADLLRMGRELRPDPKRPAGMLQRRFWKDVSVKETPQGFNVMLDVRPVRTATKEILSIPANKHRLATAVALEWDLLVSAQQALKSHYIPLTALTSRAIDIHEADAAGNSSIRDDIITMLLRYLSTDTLLCWAPERNIHESPAVDREEAGQESPAVDREEAGQETLRSLQMRVAQPIISYLTSHIWPGVKIIPIMDVDSILPRSQPTETVSVIRGWISGLPPFELAGLERAVLAGKSLLVGSRLLAEWSTEFARCREDGADRQERFGIEEAAEACSLEVRWQTGMWGEVEDTHDVEREDLRRQFGSVILLVN